MQKLTKQKYFYYIAFMLMASAYLPLVFNNLPPYIRSHHLWTIIWISSILIFNPSVLLSKTIGYLLIYGLFLFVATKTIWSSMDDWNYQMLYMEFYEIGTGISVIAYFIKSKDYLGLARITKWTIFYLFITSIMTIISSAIDPMYARNMVGLGVDTLETERIAILSFRRFGGGSYSTAGAFMSLFPIILYYYKNIKMSLISKRNLIILSILIFLALLGMQIFANILIAIAVGCIGLFGIEKMKQSILVLGLFFLIYITIPKDIVINSLNSMGDYFYDGSELNYKIKDFALFIELGGEIDANTGAGGRVERYPMLIETFIKSPILGCFFFSDEYGNGYKSEGGHLYWMNKLTITGIVGLFFFLLIIYNFFKKNIILFNSTYKLYYILASFSILSLGLMKAIAGRDTWYAFFILLPGLYYLPLLKNK
jgi:hypothetical protein